MSHEMNPWCGYESGMRKGQGLCWAWQGSGGQRCPWVSDLSDRCSLSVALVLLPVSCCPVASLTHLTTSSPASAEEGTWDLEFLFVSVSLRFVGFVARSLSTLMRCYYSHSEVLLINFFLFLYIPMLLTLILAASSLNAILRTWLIFPPSAAALMQYTP